MKLHILVALTLVFLSTAVYADGFERVSTTYKEIGDVQLEMAVYTPANHVATDKRAAAVFFFGGGWRGGQIGLFKHHAEYLAKRGMVVFTPEYRIRSKHDVTPDICVQDARSAVRWVRIHANDYGVDPDRLLVGGGSAGGHLALTTTLLEDNDEPGEDTTTSSAANALALFNPATDMSNFGTRLGLTSKKALSISPLHHVKKNLPPGIAFHGDADTVVPYSHAVYFMKTMKSHGNDYTLHTYEGEKHSFFNLNKKDGKYFRLTIQVLDDFLVGLGYLETAEKK